MRFYGIADAHGLESFIPKRFSASSESFDHDSRELSIMILRARANRHRHAVVYDVDLPIPAVKEIKQLIADGQMIEALVKLKESATHTLVETSPGSEKSWRLIPNPDLDPYR